MPTASTRRRAAIAACAAGSSSPWSTPTRPGLLVKPDVARAQLDADRPKVRRRRYRRSRPTRPGDGPGPVDAGPTVAHAIRPSPRPHRPSGSTARSPSTPTRVGRDASRIADEVIAHLTGLVGANVTVTLEIEAEIPSGASDHVVRTVTENSRTLKFTSQGFEKE